MFIITLELAASFFFHFTPGALEVLYSIFYKPCFLGSISVAFWSGSAGDSQLLSPAWNIYVTVEIAKSKNIKMDKDKSDVKKKGRDLLIYDLKQRKLIPTKILYFVVLSSKL